MNIPHKTLEDLEFDKVLAEVEKYAKTPRVQKAIRKLTPFENPKIAMHRLRATSEYLSGLQSENRFPFGDYQDIREDLDKIDVEGVQLPASVFLEIKAQTLQIKALQKFITEFESYFPVFHRTLSKIVLQNEIIKLIDTVFDKHGEIKDKASARLKEIRIQTKQKNKQVNSLFQSALKTYADYLDEIKESVLDEKRVLAVNAVYRKKVPGRFLGTSKTGSIAFIEPENTLKVIRELEELKEDEKEEIRKILKDLTEQISVYQPELIQYQNFLFQLDLIASQAHYAIEIDACLPQINSSSTLKIINGYHPILFLKHKKEQKTILPQSMELHPEKRILVISGPNAGGKSITLKTVGLLQLMLQSGLLIPVHAQSNFCFFEQIFTDIGDNQSIENQLSTYSYRLKQMQYFLKHTHEKTLLLIDEFGTGSDPELGGALAEVFLEEFYEMNAFGVLTTHYTNIKVLVENLDHALNACMLFDEKSLEPMFVLEVGQAGSSFTFEVAQKNRIPFRLINRAKKKIERNKVRLDKTILKLQQEKFELQKTKDELKQLKKQSKEDAEKLSVTQSKIENKLVDFNQLYEQEQRLLHIGKKLTEWTDEYQKNRNRKKLVTQFLKWVEMENAKKSPEQKQEKIKQKKINQQLKKELKNNADKIETLKENKKKQEEKATKIMVQSLKIGDRVRIKGSKSVGTIDKIEEDTLHINYGMFMTKINVHEIEKI